MRILKKILRIVKAFVLAVSGVDLQIITEECEG